MAAQVFESGNFLNIFLRFLGFWGSFSYKNFSYKKTCTVSYYILYKVFGVNHFVHLRHPMARFTRWYQHTTDTVFYWKIVFWLSWVFSLSSSYSFSSTKRLWRSNYNVIFSLLNMLPLFAETGSPTVTDQNHD